MGTPFFTALFALTLTSSIAAGQEVDTLVDVGGYRLHFHIIQGKGVPILFESGGGDDRTVWKDLLEPIAAVTGTTLITYDRAGFGQSEMDTTQHGIVNDTRGLETGLAKLGYAGDILLVAHSLGGFYATFYAARNPRQVKAAVLVDANHVCFFTDEHLLKMQNSDADLVRLRNQALGRYYLAVDFETTVDVMRRTAFPAHIPVLDIVAERTLFEGTPDAERWRACHQQFVGASPERRSVTAYGSGHYVFFSNPELVIAAVVATYSGIVDDTLRPGVLERAAGYALGAINEVKRRDMNYLHSEDDLNSWGYSLLQQGEGKKAVEVFKLNATLYPQSANVHDSLAEGYEAIGDRNLAIRHYKRALELDPKKRHAKERLELLSPAQGH